MKHTHNYTAFISFSAIILLLVLLFHPTLSSVLFPWKRQLSLNSYINKIQKTQTLDGQEFWKWRESYYPGSITFQKIASANTPHTVFTSKYISSYEYLVDSNTMGNKISINKNKNNTDIVFIKPLSEMKRANGFFDYKDKDKKLLEGKFWLVVTSIDK